MRIIMKIIMRMMRMMTTLLRTTVRYLGVITLGTAVRIHTSSYWISMVMEWLQQTRSMDMFLGRLKLQADWHVCYRLCLICLVMLFMVYAISRGMFMVYGYGYGFGFSGWFSFEKDGPMLLADVGRCWPMLLDALWLGLEINVFCWGWVKGGLHLSNPSWDCWTTRCLNWATAFGKPWWHPSWASNCWVFWNLQRTASLGVKWRKGRDHCNWLASVKTWDFSICFEKME